MNNIANSVEVNKPYHVDLFFINLIVGKGWWKDRRANKAEQCSVKVKRKRSKNNLEHKNETRERGEGNANQNWRPFAVVKGEG